MNINITFRQMVGSDAVKAHVHDKTAKLQKFLRQPMNANVTLAVEGLDHIAEVALASGSEHFHATERSADMYASIDMVHDKLERQIREVHSTQKKKGAERASDRLLPDEPEKE